MKQGKKRKHKKSKSLNKPDEETKTELPKAIKEKKKKTDKKIVCMPEFNVYCFDTIIDIFLKENLPKFPESLPNFSCPLFVTWTKTKDKELRGCIGNFTPEPIAKNLQDYALASAFQDFRFDPISPSDIPNLTCAVSLLSNFEPAGGIFDWEIGKHGIIINFSWKGEDYNGTFLPEVATEFKWTKEETLIHLINKSGPIKEVVKEITLKRYQSHKKEMSFEEYCMIKNINPEEFKVQLIKSDRKLSEEVLEEMAEEMLIEKEEKTKEKISNPPAETKN